MFSFSCVIVVLSFPLWGVFHVLHSSHSETRRKRLADSRNFFLDRRAASEVTGGADLCQNTPNPCKVNPRSRGCWWIGGGETLPRSKNSHPMCTGSFSNWREA